MNVIIIVILGAVFTILTIIIAALQKINDKHFKSICELYCKKYKELPMGVSILYESGPFTSRVGYSVKTGFIFIPLVFGRPSNLSSNNEDVHFMRSLDPKLTYTFKLEFYLSIVCVLIFTVMSTMIYAYDL